MARLTVLLIGALCAAAPGGAGEGPRVLFDEAHGQRFLVGRDAQLDLSHLGAVFEDAGAVIESTTAAFTTEALSRAHAVVISGAFAPVSPAERKVLLAFLDQGGSLAVMLHIAPPVADLLWDLGIAISNGVIFESDAVLYGKPTNFRVSRLAPHPLNQGLSGFGLYGAWALMPQSPGLVALASTQPHAWVDLNRSGRFDTGDAMQSFVVAVAGERGPGRFAVFGDDAMFQNQFLQEGQENRRLASNLAAWLLGHGSGAIARHRSARRPPMDVLAVRRSLLTARFAPAAASRLSLHAYRRPAHRGSHGRRARACAHLPVADTAGSAQRHSEAERRYAEIADRGRTGRRRGMLRTGRPPQPGDRSPELRPRAPL